MLYEFDFLKGGTMNKDEIIPLLKANALFHGLSDEQIALILPVSNLQSVKKDNFIIQEGEISSEAYLIVKGEVEVIKKDSEGESHRVSTLGSGDIVGEMALIDNSPRSASVRTLKDSTFLDIHLAKLLCLAEQKEAYAQLIFNISKELATRLRKSSDLAVKSLQAELQGSKIRAEMGKFLFLILVVLSAWIFVGSIAKEFSATLKISTYVTIPILLVLIIFCYRHVRTSIYPPSFYGFTLKNWKEKLIEGVLLSLPILLLVTLGKWLLVTYNPAFKDETVFETSLVNPLSPISPMLQIAAPFLYILFSPLQEFIIRGMTQNSIKASLSGPYAVFWSIILADLIFAAFHVHLSPAYALAAFMGGLFWGWLCARQESLVGPVISHMLIGGWCLSVLGLAKILTGY